MSSRLVRQALVLFVISLPVVGWAIEVGVALTASHVLGLILVALAASIWYASRPALPRDMAVVSTVAFFAVATITVVLVQFRPDIEVIGESAHWKSLKQLVGLGFGIAVFLALYCLLLWYGLGLTVMRTHYWTTAVVGVLTILQYGVASWDMSSPLANFPVDNSTLGVQRALSLMRGFPRVSLTMVEPSMLGTYLLTGWAFWLYTLDRPIFASDRARRIFVWSGVLLGAAIVVTGSRLAYVVFGVLAVGALALRPIRLRRASLIVAGVLVGLVLTGPQHTLRPVAPLLPPSITAMGSDGSMEHRVASYLVAMQMLREHPLLGAGFGTSGFYMERYWPSSFTPLPSGRVAAPTMLSQYATIAAETGLLGVLCVTVFAFGVLQRLWVLSRSGDNDRVLALGLGASVASYHIAGLANALMVYQVLLVWLLPALALTVTSSGQGHFINSRTNSLAERT